jgi:hypothetical protein
MVSVTAAFESLDHFTAVVAAAPGAVGATEVPQSM